MEKLLNKLEGMGGGKNRGHPAALLIPPARMLAHPPLLSTCNVLQKELGKENVKKLHRDRGQQKSGMNRTEERVLPIELKKPSKVLAAH